MNELWRTWIGPRLFQIIPISFGIQILLQWIFRSIAFVRSISKFWAENLVQKQRNVLRWPPLGKWQVSKMRRCKWTQAIIKTCKTHQAIKGFSPSAFYDKYGIKLNEATLCNNCVYAAQCHTLSLTPTGPLYIIIHYLQINKASFSDFFSTHGTGSQYAFQMIATWSMQFKASQGSSTNACLRNKQIRLSAQSIVHGDVLSEKINFSAHGSSNSANFGPDYRGALESF